MSSLTKPSGPAVAWSVSIALMGALGLPGVAMAVPVVPSLAPGDTYRYVFVTSNVTDATSTDIAIYNEFAAAAAAAAGLSGTWKAIASTATIINTEPINAIENIACTPTCANDPIYLVDGTQVALSTSSLFSEALMHAINVDPTGVTLSGYNYVWTGSDDTGMMAAPLGGQLATVGDSSAPAGWLGFGRRDNADTYRIYGISNEFTVPGGQAVPEPASLLLLGAGLAGVAGLRRRR